MFKNIKTAEELAAEKAQADYVAALAAWKQQREELVTNIEVTHNGVIYQGDETSQDRMSRAINALPDDTATVPWVAKDNSVQNLTKPDLKTILFAAGQEQTLIWNDGRPLVDYS